jgi:hypothetical protein
VIRKFATESHADFGIQAVDLTRDVSGIWKDNREPKAIQEHRPTSSKYDGHMDDLQAAHVIRHQMGTGGLLYINGYFSVPKDPVHDRAILNGKRLSMLFKTPATVNLQPITEIFILVTWLLSTVATTGRLFIV